MLPTASSITRHPGVSCLTALSLELAWRPSGRETEASVNSSVDKRSPRGPSQGALFPQTPVGWFHHSGDLSVRVPSVYIHVSLRPG